MLIETPQALTTLCDAIRADGVCSFDTEFVFERTYRARLGLVQLASPGGHAGAVDPLAVDDLTPVWDLLLDESVLTVVHAGEMDWKILYDNVGRLPSKIFDSQIASSFLGMGAQPGYGKLIAHYLGTELDKSQSYTDWLRRPLSEKQISYALNDVVPLLELFTKLRELLIAKGRLEWAEEEFAASLDESRYRDPEPQECYRKVKRASSLSPRQLSALREAAAWREEEALRRDLRPGFIIKDEALIAAVRQNPKNVGGLKRVRGISGEAERWGAGLVEAIQKGYAQPQDSWPRWAKGAPPDEGEDAAVGLMQVVMQDVAAKHEVPPEVVANRATLRALYRASSEELEDPDNPAFRGWRGQVLGRHLHELLEGKSAIGLDPKTRRPRLYPAK